MLAPVKAKSWSDDQFSQRLFMTKLQDCERCPNRFTDFEQKFIHDMRVKFDSREDARSLGAKPWEPSVKQINYLSSLANS